MPLNYLEPKVAVDERHDGSIILSSPHQLEEGETQLSHYLRHWAQTKPERTFLAERDGEGWRKLSFSIARCHTDSISQALLDMGLGPQRPLMILSANSVRQGVLTFGAMQVGIPVAPVSPAYSLISQDYGKLRHIFNLVKPAAIYVEDTTPLENAFASLDLTGVDLFDAEGFDKLTGVQPTEAVEVAFAKVGPDSVAKYLFTSGSTGMPKGVINTQGMLCANMQQLRQIWPFLLENRPILLDWLPWNHTFGGNIVINNALTNGGTLYIDGGKPAPGLINQTVENIRLASPNLYYNVPAGFAALLPFLEEDAQLRECFFRHLQLIFYAGAALPQDLWERLASVSKQAIGRAVPMVSAWGSTETAPMATAVHWHIDRAGVIGLPVPGTDIKMVPNGSKMELRVRGPNVTPGYLKQPDLTVAAFDDEGFYKIGDAGCLADPDDPAQGLVFDGRVAEDFKLTTGTWVNSGGLRLAALTAASPVLQDVVVAGHDRDFVALLAWLSLGGSRAFLGNEGINLEDAAQSAELREHLIQSLLAYNQVNPRSSTRIARLLLLAAPPAIDANEITDKGYINQRAVLEARSGDVERLYAAYPDADVLQLQARKF